MLEQVYSVKLPNLGITKNRHLSVLSSQSCHSLFNQIHYPILCNTRFVVLKQDEILLLLELLVLMYSC